jgi:hypothetical protein
MILFCPLTAACSSAHCALRRPNAAGESPLASSAQEDRSKAVVLVFRLGHGGDLEVYMKLTGARNAAKRHASVSVERHARPTYEIGAQVYIFPLAKTCQSLMN